MIKITREQADQLLSKKYWGKYVTFSYPGYNDVVGRIDKIHLGTPGTKDQDLVLVFIGDKKYSCSPEALKDCITLLKKEDGNTRTGRIASSERPPEEH